MVSVVLLVFQSLSHTVHTFTVSVFSFFSLMHVGCFRIQISLMLGPENMGSQDSHPTAVFRVLSFLASPVFRALGVL